MAGGVPANPAALPVPARIDASNVLEVIAQLGIECARHTGQAPPTLDFAPLKTFDSSALSLLLELSRRLGKRVTVCNPPPKLAELAELYGVDALLFGDGKERAAD